MNKVAALKYIEERLETLHNVECSKEIADECIAFLEYAKKAIEAYE